MCFQKSEEAASGDTRISQIVRQEFQTDGPATEKARRPYVCNRCRGRTRSRRLADLTCCKVATSETGRQR